MERRIATGSRTQRGSSHSFREPSLRRSKGIRGQNVFIREKHEVVAMSWDQRLKSRMRSIIGASNLDLNVQDDDDDDDDDIRDGDGGGDEYDEEAAARRKKTKKNEGVQYRLEAARHHKQSLLMKILSCNGRLLDPTNGGMPAINSGQKLAMYLHWMFRVNFVFLFAVMCITFFALVILFSAAIAGAGKIDTECVRIGGEEFDAGDTAFADAFALSWTTFSTVGYGSTYPALGHENENPTNCFFINFICSLESLLGVLYSGFCGAILFGKVLRIQSHAQVSFSDPLVVRYGAGVADKVVLVGGDRSGGRMFPRVESAGGSEDDDDDKNKIPCPVLEFRIVNRLHNEKGGEIMDATLNVVANVDANDGTNPSDSKQKTHSSGGHESTMTLDSVSDNGSISDTIKPGESEGTTSSRYGLFSNMKPFSRARAVQHDDGGKLVSKHIFSKMLIEAADHPFFKRVWLARHVLDDQSPILKPKIRRLIRRNNGSWPERLNNHAGVRDSLQFNQILVSLNGVSNVSASPVYGQKIYDFVDVNVGYQFVNLLYRDHSSSHLAVDIDLINDVCEQNGGGGEPLMMD